MNPRVVPRDRLAEIMPTLLPRQGVIVLTPATLNVEWAVDATWDLARAVASASRPVTLIDLSLDQPVLDRDTAAPASEGIVDAFLYGVSLSHVARAQDAPGLHFIPAGTPPGDSSEVLASPRWPRLSRGFVAQGALMLLYAPPASLGALSLDPDALIVLSPNGYDPEGGGFPKIADRIDSGIPLMAVVTGASEPVPPSPTPGLARPSVSAFRPRSVAARAFPVKPTVIALAAMALAAIGVVLARRGSGPPAPARSDTVRPRARSPWA